MGRSDPGGLGPLRVMGVVSTIVLADAFTKFLAVDRLVPVHMPHPVLGEWLRLTLVYNPGAAFGLHVGPWSRGILIGLALVALVVLWGLYRTSAPEARVRVLAIAAVAGGALGNLVDRIRSPRGVVDFIDVGVGQWRWPTFNVADMAVSAGAITLAIVLWREDAAESRERSQVGDAADDPATS